MKSLQKSGTQYRQNLIHLNGQRNSSSARKNDQVKSQIDVILQRDYSTWRNNRSKFDALNSLTAKSSQVIQSYVKGIYIDYHIQDPLDQRNGKNKGLSIINQQFNQNIESNQAQSNLDLKFLGRKTQQLRSSQRNAFETPVKHQKKGLQLTNYSKQHKQTVSRQKQTPEKPKNVFINNQPEISPNKVKFIERTAPSHDSSFALSNSRNLGLSSAQLTYSGIKNGTRQSLMFNSRLSIANRLIGQNLPVSNIFSNQTLTEQNKPSVIEFKSTRQFLNRRKQQNIPQPKQKKQPMIGSQVSLGQNNPEREQQKMKNQIYASQFLTFAQRKTLFGSQQKIKQSFRYCVGCELAILQANIGFHEQQCNQFKQILHLTTKQNILKQLENKINRIVEKVCRRQKQIHEKDSQNMLANSRILINQIKKSSINGDQKLKVQDLLKSQQFTRCYEKVIYIGTNWGLLTEQINKLKWFLLVKRNFETLKLQNGKIMMNIQ